MLITGIGILLLAAGCGGEEAGFATTAFKPTVAPENVDVTQLVIGRLHLPEGFVIVEAGIVDKIWRDPAAALERMESWGKVSGYKISFDKGVVEEKINVSVSVYGTEAGATKDATFEEDMWEQRMKRRFEDRGGTNVSFEELSDLKIGNYTRAARFGATFELLGTPRRVESVAIVFRRSYVTSLVSWMSIKGGVLSSDVLELATKQDQLIKSVLSGSGPAKSAAEIEPSANVSATELLAAYRDNPVTTDAEYKNKTVLITGHIDRIVSGDYPKVIFEGGDLWLEVACYFGPRDVEDLTQLREGQLITLTGTVRGKIIDVQLGGCSVLPPVAAGRRAVEVAEKAEREIKREREEREQREREQREREMKRVMEEREREREEPEREMKRLREEMEQREREQREREMKRLREEMEKAEREMKRRRERLREEGERERERQLEKEREQKEEMKKGMEEREKGMKERAKEMERRMEEQEKEREKERERVMEEMKKEREKELERVMEEMEKAEREMMKCKNRGGIYDSFLGCSR